MDSKDDDDKAFVARVPRFGHPERAYACDGCLLRDLRWRWALVPVAYDREGGLSYDAATWVRPEGDISGASSQSLWPTCTLLSPCAPRRLVLGVHMDPSTR